MYLVKVTNHASQTKLQDGVSNEDDAPSPGYLAQEPWSSRLHIIFTFLLIELTFFFSCSILVLLIFRNQIVHIAFRLRELHLVHPFACVPVKESLPAKHGSEVFCNA